MISYTHSDNHFTYYTYLLNDFPVRLRKANNSQIDILYSDVAKAMGYTSFGHFILGHSEAIEILLDLNREVTNHLHLEPCNLN